MKCSVFFTAKGTSLRECTPFEPFCIKIRGGLTSRGEPEKSQKVLDHRNDVSPLTQGLRYRAACDSASGVTVQIKVVAVFIRVYVYG